MPGKVQIHQAERRTARPALMISPQLMTLGSPRPRNANPASSDYLIPTTVTIPGVPDTKISYPAGQVFKPKFSPEGIAVYEGSVAIRAKLPKGSLASTAREPLLIQVQACTTQICLAPATLDVPLGR